MIYETSKRIKVIVTLELLVSALIVLGSLIENQVLRVFYFSYFADIIIPFGFYFLLIPSEKKYSKLKSWFVKGVLIFLLCALSETLQYYGIFALARIFDPIDYVMYGVGVILAVILDRQIFKRYFSFWN